MSPVLTHRVLWRMLIVLILLILKVDSSKTNKQNCSNAVEKVLDAAYSGVSWAVEMTDASAKPHVGILGQGFRFPFNLEQVPLGSYQFIGNYDQCLGVTTTEDFGTSYCRADLQIKTLGRVILFPPSHVFVDICVPDICNGKDLVPVLQNYVKKLPETTMNVDGVVCFERQRPVTYKAIAVVCILSLLLCTVAMATIYDVVYMQNIFAVLKEETASSSTHNSEDNGVSNGQDPDASARSTGQVLLSFSLYTNISNMLSTNQSKGSIPCINGIRVLTTMAIVMGHVFYFGEPAMENVTRYMNLAQSRWSFQPLLLFHVSVDVFFVVSGLLITHKTMRELKTKTPTLRYFGSFYFHRYWRLTPPYILSMMTYVALFKYISDGPFWPQGDVEINECEDSWWANVFYINVLRNVEETCFPWSWSLSVEMLFFLASPITLLAFYYYDRRGLWVPVVMIIGSASVGGYVTLKYHLVPTIEPTEALLGYMNFYYMNPFARIGPYLVGMVTGYLLHITDSKVKLSKRFVTIGWVLSNLGLFLVVASLYGHHNGERLSEMMSAVFNGLHKTVLAISIAWIIFACSCGYGGIVNRILSWKAFMPLSCISYCTYLIHPLVMRYFFLSQRRLFYMNDINIIFIGTGCLVISLIVAALTYLLFEAPFTNLEKAVRTKDSKSKIHQN